MQRHPIPEPLIKKLIKKAQGLIQGADRFVYHRSHHKIMNVAKFIIIETHSGKGLPSPPSLTILNLKRDVLLRVQYLPYHVLKCYGSDYGWMTQFLSVDNASFITPYQQNEQPVATTDLLPLCAVP